MNIYSLFYLSVSGYIQILLIDAYPDYLILTPLINDGKLSLARNLSEVGSKNFNDVKSHSGFITVKEEYNSNLFFWYFPHEKPAETPWIIWLQGGPGYSSLFGLFEMVGPFAIENGKVTPRNVSWSSSYSLLFIDNPVGSGFSFTDDESGYVNNEDDVGAQLFELLRQFLKVFPELRQAPLFIAGESYGGKYVPALGLQIHRNKDLENLINFRGIFVGNGMIDPHSMMHYSDLCSVMGLVAGQDLKVLRTLEEQAVQFIDQGKMVDAANKFNETIEFIKKKSGVHILNFNHDPSSEPPAFEEFVKRANIRNLMHTGSTKFDLNNQLVYTKMLPDIMNTTKPFVEELLEHYGVMCYSGQLDVIIPYGVSKNLYPLLRWSKSQEYMHAPRVLLRSTFDKSVIAYKKSGGNFVEVLVRRAGHLVAKEQPEVAKYLLDSFIEEFI